MTTITQDVDDFLETPFGKEIVTNSSIQILLKQHSAAINQVGEVFYLSEGEKQLLLTAEKGEGIFFAGQNHVALRVIASEDEHKLITSNPEEILKWKTQKASLETETKITVPPVTKPTVAAEEKGVAPLPKTETPEIKPVDKSSGETKPPVAIPTTTPVVTTKEATILVAKPETPTKAEVPVANPADSKVLFKAEVVGSEVEKSLEEKIKKMEDDEKKLLEEHQKEKEEAEKKKLTGTFSGFGQATGSLGKSGELFKSAKLPPLPPLPKFDSNFGSNKSQTSGAVLGNQPMKKPVFINQPEVKIPQPPQLAKAKVLKTETPQTPPKSDNKLSYDELFGDSGAKGK